MKGLLTPNLKDLFKLGSATKLANQNNDPLSNLKRLSNVFNIASEGINKKKNSSPFLSLIKSLGAMGNKASKNEAKQQTSSFDYNNLKGKELYKIADQKLYGRF
tara:strand:- start:263 stop:574 length:312 start_codon:yes stop_codon:yes gene_type:complete